MKKKPIWGIMLTLLVVCMVASTLNIQPVRASETIYIRVDGSIDPTTAPISSVDNVTYVFKGNISDKIVVERSSIIIDGNGYTLQGSGSGNGFSCGINTVTIRNTNIQNFTYGIYLYSSSNSSISGNNIANNEDGIRLEASSDNSLHGNNIANNGDGIAFISGSYNNTISGNNITANSYSGICLYSSSNDSISGNNITANFDDGIYLYSSSNSSISGNNIANSWHGIYLWNSYSNTISGNNIANNDKGIYLYSSSAKSIYHNNFINNHNQAYSNSVNTWDDGYPSGGNYWSDYTGGDVFRGPYQNLTSSDGIGDTPYVIDAANIDHYPLVNPWPASLCVQKPKYMNPFVGQSFALNVTAANVKDLYAWELKLFWNFTLLDLVGVDIKIPPEWGVNYVLVRNETSEDLGRYWLALSALYPAPSISGNLTVVSLTFNLSYTSNLKADYGKTLSTLLELNDTVLVDFEGYDITHDVFDLALEVTLRLIGDIIGPNNTPPDGKVDIRDIAFAASRYGTHVADSRYDIRADITGPIAFTPDGMIDIRDIGLIAKHFGEKIDP